MGICIVRCCRALLKENGELAYPVINWMDKRLNKPYEYIDAYREVRYITTTSGYITHRLTGEFKDTCANYIGWWPMDNDRLDWSTDPAVWQSCNLTRDRVLDVVKPGEILGYLSERAAQQIGLPAGLPVVATAHDKAVEALGAGSLDEGVALISLAPISAPWCTAMPT
jgi:sugar (pentulose or hexulose) kinase